MSMRQHQIRSALNRFVEEDYDTVTERIQKAASSSMSTELVTVKAESTSHEDSIVWKVGRGSVWLGTAILSVPDPIPFVDEMVGVGLVAGGAALMYSQQR